MGDDRHLSKEVRAFRDLHNRQRKMNNAWWNGKRERGGENAHGGHQATRQAYKEAASEAKKGRGKMSFGAKYLHQRKWVSQHNFLRRGYKGNLRRERTSKKAARASAEKSGGYVGSGRRGRAMTGKGKGTRTSKSKMDGERERKMDAKKSKMDSERER